MSSTFSLASSSESASNTKVIISFVLVLCSVYGTTNFFEWRLLNAIMVFITTAFIFCFNSVYFTPQFDVIKNRVMDNGFFRTFSGFVSEPILFLTNCLFSLIFIVSGIVRYAVRKHAKKVR